MEIWKDIKGFEGVYQVSNFGNVKHLSYEQRYVDKIGRNMVRKIKEHILKPHPMKCENGYLGVSLYKNGEKYTKSVHRLTAETFVPNPNNLPQVNHKDENKLNNNVSNLEWCTCSYNINYGSANKRRGLTLSRRVYMNEAEAD